jgi:DNA polymerase III alpha subunit
MERSSLTESGVPHSLSHPLWIAHSHFSMRYGTLSPEKLVETAVAAGVTTLALTDINNTSAALTFVRACEAQGIKPVLGIEFRDAEGRLLYIGLAQNNRGWANLCHFLTEHSLDAKPLPEVAPAMEHIFLLYPSEVKPLRMFRDYEFIAMLPGQITTLYASPLQKRLDKLVAVQSVVFQDEAGYKLHKILRAIDKNTLITRLSPTDVAPADACFRPQAELEALYATHPRLLTNAQQIFEQCGIAFETGLKINKRSYTQSKAGDLALLTKLSEEGCARRFAPKQQRKAQERLKKELKVIEELDFGAYFLITWDVIRYARQAGYFHVGRGSGANSIVAYCIGITDVDPLELDLYFERFINPHRVSPPDFDVDFSWDERDDVTDYLFKRYGRHHTALLATYSTFQYNAAVREVGKVFGLPKAEIDKICDALPQLTHSSGSWEWSSFMRKG